MIRIRFLFRNVENSQVAKNKCWGGEGADEEKKQLLHPWRSCFNYVTISPEFQFWSVHYNNRSLARSHVCTHYFQHPLIAFCVYIFYYFYFTPLYYHLILWPHCVLQNFLAVCRYASIRLSGAHKCEFRQGEIEWCCMYMCGHYHCELKREEEDIFTQRAEVQWFHYK